MFAILHALGMFVAFYSNGMHHSGQFLTKRASKWGTLTLPDGSQFTGEFKDGKWVRKRVDADAEGSALGRVRVTLSRGPLAHLSP
jgi:hypothetical protein